MDLRLLDAEPTDAERAAIDAVVGAAAAGDGRVVRGDRHRRHLLLPALRAAQRRVGWVSEGALGYASRRLDVPPADAYGVASFYALLALEERPAEVLHVCTDLACALAAPRSRRARIPSPCLGLCELAPASLRTIAGDGAARDPATRRSRLPVRRGPAAQAHRRRCRPDVARGVRRRGGSRRSPAHASSARRRCGASSATSGLLGRGGAAFPTGAKWDAVARAARAAALPRLQRGRVGARARSRIASLMEQRPVRRRRGDGDRDVRDRLRARLPLHPRRVPPRARADPARDRGVASGSTASSSSSGSAPARTSAARRRRSSSRSRATAASRATSRRSRSRSACSASRRS